MQMSQVLEWSKCGSGRVGGKIVELFLKSSSTIFTGVHSQKSAARFMRGPSGVDEPAIQKNALGCLAELTRRISNDQSPSVYQNQVKLRCNGLLYKWHGVPTEPAQPTSRLANERSGDYSTLLRLQRPNTQHRPRREAPSDACGCWAAQ
jgi:hypothetical protein